MFSLQRLLGKEDKFFDLLEASAEESRHSVQALKKFVKDPKNLDEFVLTRRKDKAINAQISEALCTTFVTALEREDIEALSNALYKIPKTVEKIGERILIAPKLFEGVDISKELDLLGQATDLVVQMIKELRRGVKPQIMKDLNDRLQYLEGQGDKMVLESLRRLYSSNQATGVQVVFLKDLFELLEKVTDRCRDAGNVIIHIVLKNS